MSKSTVKILDVGNLGEGKVNVNIRDMVNKNGGETGR